LTKLNFEDGTGSNWDYEDLKPYVEKVVNGEENIL
jgi:hypothetical protein